MDPTTQEKAPLTGAQNEATQQVPPDPALAMTRKMTKERISEADKVREKYKQGKAMLDQRIIENEKWYRMRHWEVVMANQQKNNNDPLPTSAYLLNSLANKHADAMDNYPAPVVLPREQADEPDAKLLTGIMPVVMKVNNYQKVYSDIFWYKLKSGTGVHGVFWDKKKLNGLGDVTIKKIDLLNLNWEPMISDVQDSKNLFHVELFDRETLVQTYPQLKDATTGHDESMVSKYALDEDQDTKDKLPVVDWYYKVQMPDGRTLLHFCKYCAGVILYASEDDPELLEKMQDAEGNVFNFQRGYYDHGLYPFVFDVLFPLEGMPVGFGYVDVSKSPQIFIDKLDQVMLTHGYRSTRQRFLIRKGGKVNEKEFADWEKDFVHIEGAGDLKDSVVPITLPQMGADVLALRNGKAEELKETGGNRDFSQGSTASGVTAASAIAALQEAGSKLSRDMIKSSYMAFEQVCVIVLELIRQFYTDARSFRIIGENGMREYVTYSGKQIAMQQQGDGFVKDAYRVPIFDIDVVAQKQSPFSTVAQNERAKEMYAAGFFRPDNADQALAALSMMQFEGIEKVREIVSKNGTLLDQLMQVLQLSMGMAVQLDQMTGVQQYAPQVAQIAQMFAGGGQMQMQAPGQVKAEEPGANTLGDNYSEAKGSTAAEARKRTAQNSTPKA